VPAADDRGRRAAGPRTHRRLAVAFVLLLLAFAVLAALVGVHAASGLDGRLITWFDDNRIGLLDRIGLGFAWVGVWWILGSVTLVLTVLLALAGRRRDAGYFVATMALSAGLNLLLKVMFRRPPPGGISGVIHPANFAFPSGHTMSATAFATALVLIAWPTRWRWPILVGGSIFALGMGLSRTYMAVHWPTDVAAGWAMGAAVALGVRLVLPAAYTAAPGPAKARPQRRVRRAGERQAKPTATPIEVVFFDWGSTLMADDAAQSGPMAAWPEVRAVDGAQDALRRLRPSYRLLVATNADDSGERSVLAALARVGLDEFLDGVVSSRDVGARKPAALFYRAALLRAGRAGLPLAPARAVMVGDSWPNDVAGARAAGLRVVWLNPSKARRPAGAAAPDAEIRKLAALPQALAKLSRAAPVAPPRRAG
jgi:membrane-associated phospholipid phosphatase/beta-phosphoglucomutase-like phosphatase (HAD superfamily)